MSNVQRIGGKELHGPQATTEHAYAAFQQAFPGYLRTAKIDELRATDFARLDEGKHVYLDYTGGGLYSELQLGKHMEVLSKGVYGNPHSSNPSSMASTQLDDRARKYVLEYFNASSDEYVVIFTRNASGALKIVGESYPFGPNSRYLLMFDNHNAVNGVREFARSKGASITYVPNVAPDLRIDSDALRRELARPAPGGRNLFVYPAQSNFSGVQHSLQWIAEAQSQGWDVVLDAAAFVPTNRLDLAQVFPDFVPLSFYKMFGYPTGVGCLLAKRSALERLHPPWFSGGTIEMASVQGDRFSLSSGAKAFEEGTTDYLNLPAVEFGLRYLREVGIDLIHERVSYLTAWLLEQLTALYHSSGAPVVEIYGPGSMTERGGTIAFNFRDADGGVFSFHDVENAAASRNISLRTGCFCNPGAGELAFGLTKADLLDCFDLEERTSFEQCIIAVKGKTAGAVRVSLGLVSNFADVLQFVRFAQTFIDRQRDAGPNPGFNN